MREPLTVQGPEEILEEWSALHGAAEESEDDEGEYVLGSPAPAPRASPRDLLDRAVGTFRARAMPRADGGRRRPNPLLGRCLPQNVQRLEDACMLEGVFEDPRDHGLLILGAARVLESELDHLLSGPARRLGGDLLEAFGAAASPKQREAMAAWLAGRLPTTIGTVELVLHALAEGLARRVPAVASFVSSRFDRDYAPLLEQGGLIRCAGRIRVGFRNPAAHGNRRFGSADYAVFSNLLLGRESIRDWIGLSEWTGPCAPEEALLHHHLGLARSTSSSVPPDARDDLERPGWEALLDLARRPPSTLEVSCRVEGAGGWPTFGWMRRAFSVRRRLRIGESLRVALRVNRTAEVCLLDRTSGGETLVLHPNAYRRTSTLPGGREVSIPDAESPEPDLCVLGPPGRDTLVAVATETPLRGAWLPDSPGLPFRSVQDYEIGALVRELESLPRERWAAACSTLEVIP